MSTTPPIVELLDRIKDAHLVGSVAGVLAWDQETMLPKGGVEWRARQLAALARITHEKSTDPRIGDLLAACEADDELVADPTSDAAANLREIRRNYDREVKLPASLVAELAATQSLAQHEWAGARAASDFARFEPWLAKMVALMRRKAECIGTLPDQEAWDVLGEGFEPGMRAENLQTVFMPLRARLTELVGDLLDNGTPPADDFLRTTFPIDRQEEFVRHVAAAMGFDFDRGRLDRSTHPFCNGSHPGDVRITTRFHDANVIDALGSTMHEAGHGIYEQGLPATHAGTPLGQAVSLGVHESQSRLWENHVGRSRGFWDWCQPIAKRFLDTDASAEKMYRAANVVRRDFIRVEADEATYNLHVIVRFELELALFRGELDAGDIPQAWNEKYRDALGIAPPDDARGCLQDVHWSCGLFGYFPTYTLGNLFAAQVFAAARRDLGAIDLPGGAFAQGEFAPLREWLHDNVHVHGSRYPAEALCRRATGSALGTDALMAHLEGKLRPAYGL